MVCNSSIGGSERLQSLGELSSDERECIEGYLRTAAAAIRAGWGSWPGAAAKIERIGTYGN